MQPELNQLVQTLRERETLVSPGATSHPWTAISPQLGKKTGTESRGLELRRGVHEWVAHRTPVGFLAACCAANLCKSIGCIVWIGFDPKAVGHALAGLRAEESTAQKPGDGRPSGSSSLLDRSIFVLPPDDATRLWAIDLALRSPGAAMVVADGSRLGVRETRRLQLAAEAGMRQGGARGADGASGGGAVGVGGVALLARRWEERAEPSAAMTRWLIQPVPTPGRRARWRLDLVRRKSSHPAISPECWFVEWDREKGAVVVPADVAGGPGAPARGEGEQPGRDGPRLRHTA